MQQRRNYISLINLTTTSYSLTSHSLTLLTLLQVKVYMVMIIMIPVDQIRKVRPDRYIPLL